jgi:hypothetical protein
MGVKRYDWSGVTTPPARKTIDLEGRLVKDGIKKRIARRLCANLFTPSSHTASLRRLNR